ncbi:hypothetical protein [uncultured Nocardioides sp.]|uniref:hypothetical protein n=1 Tax=uncultured Nocardioides sp. TaxID=198441 RepID=UPI00260EEE50|nr:hypothetical protein [uncultured Nocardioides sp.]HRD61766.1 hypothetical protein [Nocardioides sp.]
MDTASAPGLGAHRSAETRLALALERWIELVRTDRVLQVALALIIGQLVVRGWAAYGAWFVLDDFNFIARMASGLDPATAARSYNGHIMPAGMYLSWSNQLVAPWQWRLPATELVLMQAVANLAMLRLLVALHGRRWGIIPPLALFLFSVISLEGTVWWAAGINALPFEIALLLALTAHLHYLRTGRLRHALVANGWVVVGLLFYEKSALIYLAIAVFTLCWFAEGYGWQRVASAVRGRTAALAIYVATGAAFTVVYLVAGRDLTAGGTGGFPTYDVARALILDEYLPALVGGPLVWDRFGLFSAAAPTDAIILASLVTVGLVLNELLRHRSRAARALVLPAAFLVVDIVLVLLTQNLDDGADFVFDYRFQGELAAITAIALATMSMPIIGATASSTWRSPSELLDHPRRVAALVCVITALALVSTVRWTVTWHSDDRAREWVESVTGSLEHTAQPIPLVDRVVPELVMAPIDGSEGLASRLFAREPGADWVTVGTDSLRAIDDQGQLLPVLVPAVHQGRPGPTPGCGYRLGEGPTTIPLDSVAAEPGQWLRIGYLSSGSSPVRITVGDQTVDATVQPGVHALFVAAPSSFESVQISGVDPQTTVCTDDISVGVPQPFDAEGGA